MTTRDKIIELFGPGYAVGFEDGGWPVYAPRVGHWASAEIFVTSEGRYYLGRCCLPIHTFEQFAAVYRVFAGIEDPELARLRESRIIGLSTAVYERNRIRELSVLLERQRDEALARVSELDDKLAEAVEACTIEDPLHTAVGAYLSETGACGYSDGDDPCCDDPCCSYCNMANAHTGDGLMHDRPHTEPGVGRTKRRGGGE